MVFSQLCATLYRFMTRPISVLGILLLGVLLSACAARVVPEDSTQPIPSSAAALPEISLLPTVTVAPLAAEAVATVAPTPNAGQIALQERSWGVAPEIESDTWLNSAPLKLSELRGKVVLVEFWTFDCINCRNVIPALQDWQARYSDQGLVIIGVHTPEFAYEREVVQVQNAIAELGVTWPVALDNEEINWHAYQNHYWPVMYVIDMEGVIRYIQIGEGRYDTTASVIEELLKES